MWTPSKQDTTSPFVFPKFLLVLLNLFPSSQFVLCDISSNISFLSLSLSTCWAFSCDFNGKIFFWILTYMLKLIHIILVCCLLFYVGTWILFLSCTLPLLLLFILHFLHFHLYFLTRLSKQQRESRTLRAATTWLMVHCNRSFITIRLPSCPWIDSVFSHMFVQHGQCSEYIVALITERSKWIGEILSSRTVVMWDTRYISERNRDLMIVDKCQQRNFLS
jgi:hypothetical protein